VYLNFFLESSQREKLNWGSEALPSHVEIVGPFANPETRERESVMECVGADQAHSQDMAEQGHRNLADLYRFAAARNGVHSYRD